MQLRHRHIQPVALGVFDFQELTGHAAGIEHDQPAVTAHTVVFVHDRRAFGQFAQVADDRFRLASNPARAARLVGPLGEQLALGEQRNLRLIQRKAIFQRRHGHAETQRARQERRHIGDHLRLQLRGGQHFHQGFAAAGRIGGHQHAARVMAQERSQRLAGRGILRGHRQRRQGLVAERGGFLDACMIAGPHFDTRQLVEALAQRIGRLIQLVRRQQRALDIVAALFVAVLCLRPEGIGGSGHARGDHRQYALVQIIEQRCGLGEEHRQVILDARRCQPGFEILIQRAAPGIDVEAFAQAG